MRQSRCCGDDGVVSTSRYGLVVRCARSAGASSLILGAHFAQNRILPSGAAFANKMEIISKKSVAFGTGALNRYGRGFGGDRPPRRRFH
jgi:hypothetical protein